MQEAIQKVLPEIISIRRQIHQNPELSFEEQKTAKLIEHNLKSWGYEVNSGYAKTGLTAILDSHKPGKTVGIRADMDALPILETFESNYKSIVPGKMHACGHDGHMATVLLIANILPHFTGQFCGKIKFIFQPAEELGLGAKALIKENVLTDPPVNAIFGYHNLPGAPKNQILVKPGCIMAGRMVFRIKIIGKGGHSSTPEKTIDPIFIASNLVPIIHSLRNRVISPFAKVIFSVTQFNSGTAENIIPDEATLAGTIRFTDNDLIEQITTILSKTVMGITESFGAKVIIEFPDIAPATVNSKSEAELVKKTATTLFGFEKVTSMQNNIMVSEDFAYYLNAIPGCFFLIGTGENKPFLHNSNYSFDDEIIPIAAELLTQVAINFLKGEND